jgi:adenylate cyclase
VIGDAVNLAARLEALCKTYSVSLIVGEATQTAVAEQQTDAQATALNPNWIDLGSATISGIDQPVRIYTL